MTDEKKPPPRSSYGRLAHLAEELGDWDIKGVRSDLTEAADRGLNTPDPGRLTNVVKASVVDGLMAEIRELKKQVRIARGLAWSYEHRMFSYAEIGIELVDGEPVEPDWLTSPVAPYETVHELHGDGFIWGTFTAGQLVWVTVGSEPVYAQVVNALDDRATVRVLRDITEVGASPAAPGEEESNYD